MSILAITWALAVKTGSPSAKLVLIKLADNANDLGKCWPSLRHVCAHTELSERAVRNQIRALEKLGLLEVVQRSTEGVNLPNVYTLKIPQTVGVGHDVPGGGAPDAPRVGHDVPPNPHSKPSKEPSEDNTTKRLKVKRALPEGCPDQFDREKACGYWRGHGRDDLCDTIEDNVLAFRAHHQKLDSRFADWSAGWTTWYTKAIQFSRANGNGHGRKSATANAIEGAAMLYRQWEAEERDGAVDAPQPSLPSPHNGAKPIQAHD